MLETSLSTQFAIILDSRGAGMADRLVSKTNGGNPVRVRLPLPALLSIFQSSINNKSLEIIFIRSIKNSCTSNQV